MGRTNIVLDDDVVRRAMKLTHAQSKREVVDIALRALVAKGSLYRSLLALEGKVAWDGDVSRWRERRR